MAERRPQRPSRSSVRPARLPRARNAANRPHRLSRAEREAKRQKQLYIGIGAVVAVIAVILIGTFVWTDVVRPRQVLASVNGTDISRQDYWHARGVTLVDQVDQYSYLAGVVGGDQASQYQSAAANAQTELDGLWGSTDVNDQYLQQMIDDQLYVQYANTLGVTITDQDVDTFILNRFAPQDAPLLTPTVEPTLVPERASWATQTAIVTGGPSPTAALTDATPVVNVEAGTPAAATPPGVDAAPALATPLAGGEAATPIGPDPAATPSGVPESAVGTPAVSPTPDPAQARSTAEAGYKQYRDRAFDAARIDESDYREWVAVPALAQQRVTGALEGQLGQSAPQVHGYHILVATQELAAQISTQLASGADFGEIARSQSIDTTTGPNGGDLGWYSQYDVEEAIWSATSGLTAGQTTAPFQTAAGWEIVRVEDTSPDRAFTDDQLTNAQSAIADQWLSARSGEANISGEAAPTPTPAVAEFTPPVNAPTGVAVPEGTPAAGTPESGALEGGTPTPMGPDATPIAATPLS